MVDVLLMCLILLSWLLSVFMAVLGEIYKLHWFYHSLLRSSWLFYKVEFIQFKGLSFLKVCSTNMFFMIIEGSCFSFLSLIL